MAEEAGSGDEARMRVEGGFAHLPGRATNSCVPFGRLLGDERAELTRLADEASFFDCAPLPAVPRPDARTYTIGLTIDGRSRELRVAEPIHDPKLAALVSTVRRITRERGGA